MRSLKWLLLIKPVNGSRVARLSSSCVLVTTAMLNKQAAAIRISLETCVFQLNMPYGNGAYVELFRSHLIDPYAAMLKYSARAKIPLTRHTRRSYRREVAPMARR